MISNLSKDGEKEIDNLISLLSKLPGLGPRSARRAVLQMIKKREFLLDPIVKSMSKVGENIKSCSNCGNLSLLDLCSICSDESREKKIICVVEDVSDLWAMERSGVFRGGYYVLGGLMSSFGGLNPEDLKLNRLINRIETEKVVEVILALDATMIGQTTAHYISEKLMVAGTSVTSLAQGVPIGGELDYLDDGTIRAAFSARRAF
jgi:recombination protein RecR